MNKPTVTNRPTVNDGSALIYDHIEDKTAFRDIMSLNKYDFIDHTYDGSNGYYDKSYLIPHPRETAYDTRRRVSIYINIFKPVVNCMIDPVFSSVIKREFNNDKFQGFVDNADNCGTPMENIVRELIADARRKDVSFCVMDNFSENELAEYQTGGDALKNRKYPYICMKKTQEVYSWEVNKFGGLESIDFFDEKIKIIGKSGKEEEVQTYKQWTKTGWMIYSTKKDKNGKENLIKISEGFHTLGIIPVYPVLDFCKTKSLKELPVPNLTDMAMLCFALFNKESLGSELEMYQCFSLLYLSGADTKTIQTIGAANFISVSNDSKFVPGYASPDPSHLVNIIKNCDRLEEKIYKYAQQKGVIAVEKANSGVSKEWDFRAEETVLKLTDKARINLENWLASTFGLYIKSQFDYNTSPINNFQPNFKQDQVKSSLAIIDMSPPAPLASRIWKRIAINEFGLDSESKDTLIEELDADMEEKRKAENNLSLSDDEITALKNANNIPMNE
jgi:hypothetical protein